MNLRKLIVLWTLSVSGVCHAAGASLTVSVPSEPFAGLVSIATVTVNTGSGVLGAADFVITYDTAGVTVSSVSLAYAPFQGTTYVDSSVVGRIHILALNGASLTSPTGSVDLATLTFIPTRAGAGVLDAQVNLVIDTQPVAYIPVTVSPGTFIALSDTLPPRTTLAAGTPHTGADPLIISSTTPLSLSAVDDATVLGDALGAGVVETRYAIDGGTFIASTEPFVVTSPGSHSVSYFSNDRLGQVEIQKDTSIVVDATPPSTALLAGGVILSSSPVIVSSSTLFSLSAIDATPGAGVRETWLQIDGGSYQLTSVSFSVSLGTHSLSFYSVDNFGNQESVQARVVILVNAVTQGDTVPPESSLIVGQPMRQLNSGFYMVTSNTPLSISAIDPLRDGVASGVRDSWVAIDAAAFQSVNGSFFLNATRNGLHLLRYYSRDNASNVETAHLALVIVVPNATSFAGNRNSLLAGVGAHQLGGALALTDFIQRETFVFPNPARAGVQPTIHVEVGIADEVRIRIFDAAGREVREATLTSAPTLINGQYAYEFVWEGSIPSGVYFYAIRAQKAGADDIEIKGKFAVIR